MMMMLDEGAIVFIQFVDAVSVMSIAPGPKEMLPSPTKHA